MPVVDGREYRNVSADGFKAVPDSYVVEGYATTFDDAYPMPCGTFEVVDRHAFDCADMSDVIFQFDHAGTPMARLRNRTLTVSTDDHGLHVRADLGGSAQGRDMYESIKNGLVDRMSIGFTVDEDGWEYDSATRTATITRVAKLYDVSSVSFPANEGTEIHARSYLDGVIEADERESFERCKERRAAAVRLNLLTI